jgi:cation diffusion facilitator family transporter
MNATNVDNPEIVRARSERRALRITIAGNLLMACLGLGFAISLVSDAILLDGMFSFTDGLLGLVSLRVATLIWRGSDTDSPFGYAMYEPLLNIAKALMITTIVVIALVNAIALLMSGGRYVDPGWAVIYALIAFIGCMALAALTHRLARTSGSPIVALDAKEWLVDGSFSGAVAVAFGCTYLLVETDFAFITPYADPVIVVILCLLLMPIPYQVIRDSWRQIVGKAPEDGTVKQIVPLVADLCQEKHIEEYRLRVGKIGRLVYVQLYCLTTITSSHVAQVSEQDSIRELLYERLRTRYPDVAMDVIFTTDQIWAERAIRPVTDIP